MDTGNVTCLYTNTARAHASGEFAIIPPAGADDDTFVKKDRTENCIVTLIKPSTIACTQRVAKLRDDMRHTIKKNSSIIYFQSFEHFLNVVINVYKNIE